MDDWMKNMRELGNKLDKTLKPCTFCNKHLDLVSSEPPICRYCEETLTIIQGKDWVECFKRACFLGH